MQQARHAGPEGDATAGQHLEIAAGFPPMEFRGECLDPACRLKFRLASPHVRLDTLLTPADFQQQAIALYVPFPVQPGIGECLVECDAVTIPLRIRQGAVHVEKESLKAVHGKNFAGS